MAKTRSYKSELRQQRADATRLRIRKAARKLFETQGFAATTIAEIARRARVAPPTVYAAFESKAGIVAAMLEEMETEAGIAGGLERLFAEPDPHRQLERYVEAHCSLFESSADILRAAIEARHADAAALANEGNAHRRYVLDRLTTQWRKRGALRGGLTQRTAAEQMWLLTTAEGYLTARDDLGWSPAQYGKWLLDLFRTRILKPRR